jgi:hypothetical protein
LIIGVFLLSTKTVRDALTNGLAKLPMIRGVIVVVCLIAALAGCRPKPSPIVLVDPALAILVTPDATLLAGVRMKQLRETPLYKRYVEQWSYPSLDQFARDTGIDPRKDIWELLITSDGTDTVVMARGKFSEFGMEPKLDRGGAQRFTYKGYSLIGDERLAVTFMNSTTAIAGPTRSVQRILDAKDNTQGIPGSLEAKIRQIPSSHQIWFVANVGGKVPRMELKGNAANLANFVRMLDSATAMFEFADTVRARIEGVAFTDNDAKQLGDTVRGLLGLARLHTPSSNPELLRAFDNLQVGTKDRTVTLTAGLPPEVLEDLLKFAGVVR